MQKQDNFVPREYKTDADYKLIDDEFRASETLEYTLLLGHVMVEDQLLSLLAARLGADTMPTLRGFEVIAGLGTARGGQISTSLSSSRPQHAESVS
jgi:hypothetical protein